MPQFNYSPNDKIEMIKTSNSTTSYYPATFILHETTNSKKRKKNNKKINEDDDELEEDDQLYMVEYKTLQNDVVSYVNASQIRPLPPQNDVDDCRKFDEGEIVDVLVDGCWIKASILGVLYEGFKYLVKIDNDDDDDVPIEVPRSFLRVHRDWIHGCWIPPFDFPQKDSINIEQDAISRSRTVAGVRTDANGKQLKIKLRINGTKRLLGAKFSPGTTVEVRSDEIGYEGSWYSAIIVGSAGIGKFLVEYQTLKTDDEMELLRETANEQDIRPCPPEISRSYKYKPLEEIDAWYNDGWWEGVIYEVLDDWKYIVYFVTTNEKLVFQHSSLRPHQNWVDGNWVRDLPHRSSDVNLRRSSSFKEKDQSRADGRFCKGAVVEVRSDEPGYEGSWYSAVIVRSTRKGTYLVEYITLKTEDNRDFLREEAEARNVRPCPPKIQMSRYYFLLERVDAWHNDGWWEGVISKVLADKKYKVFFETNNEELEFDHVNLRTHQEWINGNWIVATKDNDVSTAKLF